MAKYKNQFDLPYDINANTKYFWNAFIKQTLSGNPQAAIIAYHEFCKARELAFINKEFLKENFTF
jgi:hypothetical protein